MPAGNINLTDELDRLRTLEHEEKQHEAKVAPLRAAIDEGDSSGVGEDGPFDRVRQKLKLS